MADLENKSPQMAWWSQLQEELYSQGYDLDLSKKEDLTRLVIIKPKMTEDGRDVDMSIALDEKSTPIDLKIIDEEFTIDGQQFIESQGETVEFNIDRLYYAAMRGQLFIAPIAYEPTTRYRMLGVEKSGKPVIRPDEDHLSPEDKRDLAILQGIPPVPKLPKAPGRFTKFLAFFGNRKAKDTIAQYKEDEAAYKVEKLEYDEHMKAVNKVIEENPVIKSLCDAMEGLYNNNENNVGITCLGNAMLKLHLDRLVSVYPEEERVYRADMIVKYEKLKEMGKSLAETKGEKIAEDKFTGSLAAGKIGLDTTAKNLLAELLVLSSDIARGDKMLSEGSISQYRPNEDIDKSIRELRNNKIFDNVCNKLDGAELIKIAKKDIKAEDVITFMKDFVPKFGQKLEEEKILVNNSVQAPAKNTEIEKEKVNEMSLNI